jgi:NTE family protein
MSEPTIRSSSPQIPSKPLEALGFAPPQPRPAPAPAPAAPRNAPVDTFEVPKADAPKAPKPHEVDQKQFLEATADFRRLLTQGRELEAKIATQPEGSPELPKLQEQLAKADTELKAQTGYSLATAPKPGEMWIDPTQMKSMLKDGKLDPKMFPTKAAVTKPPSAEDALFAGGRTLTVRTEGGKDLTFKNADEYRKYVAEARTKAGMPALDGKPVGVHLVMEGGGGLGKRYGAATSQMLELGVVPTSLAGTSAGSIAASLIAAGADPVSAEKFMKSVDLKGNLSDARAFDTFDQALRELTGIKDRPVTFADLKIPLQVNAAQNLKTPMVFSQETTPQTPVALAVRASMSIPSFGGLAPVSYTPVRVVDPTTGQQRELTDGGTADNFPLGSRNHGLPTVGLALAELNTANPASRGFASSFYPVADDLPARSKPKEGQFILSVPTWDLTQPNQANDVWKFAYTDLDKKLDGQTRQVTRDFFAKTLEDVATNPRAKATNITTEVPKKLEFERKVMVDGVEYQAKHSGEAGRWTISGTQLPVTFTRADGQGQPIRLEVEKSKLGAMWLDDKAFGHLEDQLRPLLETELAKAARKKAS